MSVRWRVSAVAAVVVLPWLISTASAAEEQLVISGKGGTSALIDIGGQTKARLDLFGTPRLAAPDGTLGGFILYRATRPKDVVGGAAFLNVPGMKHTAYVVPVADATFSLSPGRYGVVLLGERQQTIRLTLAQGRSQRVTTRATSPYRQQFIYRASPAPSTWSDEVTITAGNVIAVAGAGVGGSRQQAGTVDLCWAARAVACAPGLDSWGASPTAEEATVRYAVGWPTGANLRGKYTLSGSATAAGIGSVVDRFVLLVNEK